MNKHCLSLLLAAALLLPALAVSNSKALADEPVYDGSQELPLLWVQPAESLRYADGMLTLRGVPATTYFSDRPNRIYGHMDNQEFAERVMAGQQADPPNAALAVLGSRETVILELLEAPAVSDQGHTLAWKVRVLSGEIPAQAGPSSLFIDQMCQPQITD